MKTLVWYPGSKYNLSKWITSRMCQHKCFVDVFGGSAIILLSKEPCSKDVYNDVFDEIYNLMLVLRDRSEELHDFLVFTPVSRKLYDEYIIKYKNKDYKDDIEKAGIILFLTKTSRNGDIKEGWYRHFSNRARTIKNTVDNLYEFSDRLRSVTIEKMDFEDCIKTYDSEDTLFYCDPPYLFGDKKKDYYYQDYKFTYTDHCHLRDILHNIDGKCIISYYDDPRLRKWYKDPWVIIEKDNIKRMSFGSDKITVGKELLIANYDITKQINTRSKKL